MYKLVKSLIVNVSIVRRFQFVGIFVISSLSACFELVSIGLVIPFISFLTNPDIVISKLNNPQIYKIFDLLNLEHESLNIIITICFISVIILSGLFRVILLFCQVSLSQIIGEELITKIFKNLISQDYIFYTKLDNSEIISVISKKAMDIVNTTITPIINIASSGIVISFIVFSMIYFIPNEIISIFLILIVSYLCISYIIKKKMNYISILIAKNQSHIIKLIQFSLGSYSELLLYKLQSYYSSKFINNVKKLRKAYVKFYVYNTTPKILIETIAIVIISVVSYTYTTTSADSYNIIPTLAAIVLAMQRLLPLCQQIFSGYNSLLFGRESLCESLKYLNLSNKQNYSPSDNTLDFEKVVFKDVWFKYDIIWVIKGLNFTIHSNKIYGIIGRSGSGKSTFIKLLIGFIQPVKGDITVSCNKTSKDYDFIDLISYVPQNVYIFDDTILENILLGLEYNHENLTKVLNVSCLIDLISDLPEGINTKIGDRGAQLSGGQCQRVAIARALYRDKKILILDEATNGLDAITEATLMKNIINQYKDVTLLKISHKLESLSNVNEIIDLS